MKVVTFKIDEELLHRLEIYAMNKRLSRSDVIREAIEKMLNNDGNGTNGSGEAKVEKVPIKTRPSIGEASKNRKDFIFITCNMRKDAWKKLRELADKMEVPLSALIDEAVYEYLKNKGIAVEA